MGCSTYCKYHKPYAKEIREAAIRGEISHPALEKLRSKLGLTRPIVEYKELNEGQPIINPFEYVVGREDGTVWIGSAPTPSPIRTSFDTTTTTTTTTASAKDDELS